MQVNKVNFQQTNFKSKFIPNAMLEQTFNRAAKENDRLFVKSMKTLLNDGKDDVLKLQQRDKYRLALYSNDKIVEEGNIYLNYYGNVGTDLINKYALKNSNDFTFLRRYNNLSQEEKKLIAEEADLIKLLSQNFENGTNYIEELQKIIKVMEQKLDENTKNEMDKLKKAIFGR